MSAARVLIAVLATLAGITAILVDYLSADASAREPLSSGLAGGVALGAAILLFAGAVPWAREGAPVRRASETALVTSVVGFLCVASAWTGLPFILGTGGAMLGAEARRGAADRRDRGVAHFATALGVAAVVLGCVALAVV